MPTIPQLIDILNFPEFLAGSLNKALSPFDFTKQRVEGGISEQRARELEAAQLARGGGIVQALPPTEEQLRRQAFIGPPPTPGFLPSNPGQDQAAAAVQGLGGGGGFPFPQAPVLEAPPPFDPTAILAAFGEGRPTAPEPFTRDQQILAVLAGLAQGAGGGSVAEILGAAGAGGLGNLLQLQTAEKAQQQQFNERTSEFERNEAIFQSQLERDRQAQELAAVNIKNQNAINQFNRNVEVFKAAKPQFQVSGPFLISISTDPETGQTKIDKSIIDQTAFLVNQMKAIQELGAPMAEVQVLLGDELEKLEVPLEHRAMFQTAAQIMMAPTTPQHQALLQEALQAADIAVMAELSPTGNPEDGRDALLSLKRGDNASFRQRQSLAMIRHIVARLNEHPELVPQSFNHLLLGSQVGR